MNTDLQYFVNRDTERKRMSDVFLNVVHNRKPAFVLIQGDYGMGKTALVEAFLEEMDKRVSGLLVGRGRCANENQQNGLLPFAQALHSLAGSNRQSRVEIGSVLDYVAKVAPGWVDVFTAGAASALQKTISESRKYFGQNYDFSPQNIQVQYATALAKITEQRPAIVFIDDFHWSDASSISLLNHLAQNFISGATLFIITYRSVEGTELSDNAPLFREILANHNTRRRFTEITLDQGIPVADYVARRYPGNTLTPALLEQIQVHTAGNPLWVSQLFTTWEESEIIKPERLPAGGLRWTLPDGDQAALKLIQSGDNLLPAISRVLEERLRLLAEDMQDLLSYAAVEGEYFSVQVLARLAGISEEQVFKIVAHLEHDFRLIAHHDFVEMDGEILDTYCFTPRYVRKVVYQRMPAGLRRILHRRVAECLESFGEDPGRIAGQLCAHFTTACQYTRAVHYALRAARLEQSHAAFAEAETWCSEGLALLEKITDPHTRSILRANLLEISGNGFLDSGAFQRAEQRYCEVLELLNLLPQSAERVADICINLAHTCRYEGDIPHALEYLELGKRTLLANKIPFGEAYLALDVNSIFLQRENPDLALYSFTKLLEYAETLPTTSDLELIKARTYNWLGVIQGDHLNRFADAAESYQKSIQLGAQNGDDYIQIMSMLNLADDYAKLHKVDESEQYVNQAEQIAIRIGDLDDQAYVMGTRGIILNMRGEYSEAVRVIQQAIKLSEQLDSKWNMGYMYTDLSTAFLGLGNLEKAESAARTAVATSTEGGIQLGYATFALGQVQSALGEMESAAACYRECIALFLASHSELNLARVQARWSADLLACGQPNAAAAHLQAAIPVLERFEVTPELLAARELLSRCEAQSSSANSS